MTIEGTPSDSAVSAASGKLLPARWSKRREPAFPYGDFKTVNRAALIHAKQRASQNDHDEITKAADELLERLDKKRS